MSSAPTRGPVQRPDLNRDLTEIFQRLDDLERVAGGIRYVIDNEGRWLYVGTNDCVDLDTLPDPLAVGGTIGVAFEDDSGCGALFGSNGGKVLIKARGIGAITLDSGASPLTLRVNGNVFEFRDDGTVHIPTGGSVIADT